MSQVPQGLERIPSMSWLPATGEWLKSTPPPTRSSCLSCNTPYFVVISGWRERRSKPSDCYPRTTITALFSPYQHNYRSVLFDDVRRHAPAGRQGSTSPNRRTPDNLTSIADPWLHQPRPKMLGCRHLVRATRWYFPALFQSSEFDNWRVIDHRSGWWLLESYRADAPDAVCGGKRFDLTCWQSLHLSASSRSTSSGFCSFRGASPILRANSVHGR
jgi:hypothetical protein